MSEFIENVSKTDPEVKRRMERAINRSGGKMRIDLGRIGDTIHRLFLGNPGSENPISNYPFRSGPDNKKS